MLKANVRWALTGALLLILFGSVQGCANDPTSVANDDPNCVWIDGVLFCS
jgi:hypothetical protein